MSDMSYQEQHEWPEEEEEEEAQLLVKKHTQYFKRTLGVLPSSTESLDTSR